MALIQLFANENPEYQKGDLTCFREKLIYFYQHSITVIPGKFSNPGMKNPSGWGWLPDVKMNILIFATVRFVHDDELSHSDS